VFLREACNTVLELAETNCPDDICLSLLETVSKKSPERGFLYSVRGRWEGDILSALTWSDCLQLCLPH
jgi:hypothetical protein